MQAPRRAPDANIREECPALAVHIGLQVPKSSDQLLMKRLYDQFTQTDFYREREEAILMRLRAGSLTGPPLPGGDKAQLHDPSDVIYYTGCVAGSLGLPLDGDNFTAYLALLKKHAVDGAWPEIARLVSELYAQANEEAIAQIKADPVLEQQPWALTRTGQKSPSADEFARSARDTGDSDTGRATMPVPPV
jgi:hypothetical protein